jgi:hypothetical protein
MLRTLPSRLRDWSFKLGASGYKLQLPYGSLYTNDARETALEIRPIKEEQFDKRPKVSGKRGPFEFILSEPTRCPNCKREINEKTLVEPKN